VTKTVFQFFFNRSFPENLDFSFNGKSVPITTSHKHLGVTFSNDAKWNKINEIENGRKNNRDLKEIKPIFTITMLDYFPHMSVFHQERTGFVTIEQEYYAFIQLFRLSDTLLNFARTGYLLVNFKYCTSAF
jgi:hypothetical protein